MYYKGLNKKNYLLLIAQCADQCDMPFYAALLALRAQDGASDDEIMHIMQLNGGLDSAFMKVSIFMPELLKRWTEILLKDQKAEELNEE